MNIQIQGVHMDLTDAIKHHVNDKISALQKFLQKPDEVAVAVEVGKTGEHHQKGEIFVCEVQLVIPGEPNVRAKEVKEDLYVAIDTVKKELQRQLVQLKEKRIQRERQG